MEVLSGYLSSYRYRPTINRSFQFAHHRIWFMHLSLKDWNNQLVHSLLVSGRIMFYQNCRSYSMQFPIIISNRLLFFSIYAQVELSQLQRESVLSLMYTLYGHAKNCTNFSNSKSGLYTYQMQKEERIILMICL